LPTNAPTVGPTNTPTAVPTVAPGICSGGDFLFELSLTLDNFPDETSWQLADICGGILLSGGSYTSQGATIDEQLCVASNLKLQFDIFDSFGDGICCGGGAGSYTVSYDGNIVRTGGDFAAVETTYFGTPPYFTCNEQLILAIEDVALAGDDPNAQVFLDYGGFLSVQVLYLSALAFLTFCCSNPLP
jgi:hypothetical protein